MITAFEDKLSLEQAILQTPEGRKATYLDYYDTNTRSAYHCNTDICVERKKGMKVNKFATGLFRLYIRSLTLQNRYRLFRRFIRIMWEKSLPYFQGTTVTLQIHNKTVFANYGYTYPIICRKFPSYNMPLVELAYQTCLSKARAISVVDIGAAIGDTVLLLESSLPGKIISYYCIDGDSQFFSYLQQNLSFLPNAFFINALLAEEKSKIRNLVNIHPGTASAQGDQLIDTTTLDCLLEEGKIGNPDLIKIDVDGYDGKVLMGAKKTIIQYKPTIIFEWHPVICRDTRNNWTDHFASLLNYGYSIFIFYDNYGNFSHIMTHIDFKAIDYLAETLIERKNTHAVYYDIIALTRESSVDIKSLIMLNNARTLKSNY